MKGGRDVKGGKGSPIGMGSGSGSSSSSEPVSKAQRIDHVIMEARRKIRAIIEE